MQNDRKDCAPVAKQRAHPENKSKRTAKITVSNNSAFLNKKFPEKQPFEACPRYSKCSVNNCPLSTKYPEEFIHSEDSAKKCTLPKSYRLKVAAQFPGVLPFGGLIPREAASKKTWDNLTPEQKDANEARLKKTAFTRVSQKEVKNLDIQDIDDRDGRERRYEFWGRN